MTDLHWALIGLGALIIVSVLILNWWQERKLRQEAAKRFSQVKADVLMEHNNFGSTIPPMSSSKRTQVDALASTIPIDVPSTSQSNTPSYEEKIEPTIEGLPDREDPSIRDEFDAPIDTSIVDISEPFDAAFAATDPSNSVDIDLDQPMVSVEEAEEAIEAAFLKQDAQLLAEAQQGLQEASSMDAPSIVEEIVPQTFIPQPEQTRAEVKQEEAGHEQESLVLPKELDGLIDLIAILHRPQQFSSALLQNFLMALTDADKTLHVHVKLPSHEWVLVTREHCPDRCIQVACSMQLADRSGYISKSLLSRFQLEVEKLGKELMAQVEWQGDPDPWRYASLLDQFCIEVDKMVGFHINHGATGPFTGTKFRGLAEANGLQLMPIGHFQRTSDDGLVLFTVENHDTLPFSLEMLRTSVIRGVAFKLDMPRVKNCPEIFNQMAVIGQQMAHHLGGHMVDDHQRPVGDTQLEIVRHQLRVIHSKMVARGIVPGSVTALRLFS